MKLSDNTLSVLKNYANINQNLLITAGSTLSTMSVQKNIFAKADEGGKGKGKGKAKVKPSRK